MLNSEGLEKYKISNLKVATSFPKIKKDEDNSPKNPKSDKGITMRKTIEIF